MSWWFSERSRSSRGLFPFVMAGAISLGAPSCLGVLELDSYAGVSEELCALYDRCYGPEAFPGCRRHVTGQMETANSDAREDFLDRVADCLDNCQSVSECLDQPLFCRSLRHGCATNAQCCGYSINDVRCIEQSCCLVDDAPCTTDADCCGGGCAGGKCHGGVDPGCAEVGLVCTANADCCNGNCAGGVCSNPCSGQGASCTNNSDCCNGNCAGGVCTNPCGALGTSCTNNSNCCSGICTGGVCSTACSLRGSACTVDSDCCSNLCRNGICRKLGCLAAGEMCLSDADCCQDSCDKGRGICGNAGCNAEDIPCSQDGDCCSGLGCDPATGVCANLTCKKLNDACSADVDCCSQYCSGSCQCAPNGTTCTQNEPFKCCSGNCENGACVACRPMGMTCTDDTQCCSGTCNNGTCCATGCPHNLCVVGGPLSIKDCAPKNVGAGAASCIAMICDQNPACCCGQWDQSCVDRVASDCKLVCP